MKYHLALVSLIAVSMLGCGDSKVENERMWFNAGFDTGYHEWRRTNPASTLWRSDILKDEIRRKCRDSVEGREWQYAVDQGADASSGFLSSMRNSIGDSIKNARNLSDWHDSWLMSLGEYGDSLAAEMVSCLISALEDWEPRLSDSIREEAWRQYLIDRKFRD